MAVNDWIPLILGYVFAVIFGGYCVPVVVKKLWSDPKWAELYPKDYLSDLVGTVERTLYVAAFQIQHEEFIGVWLFLKVAFQWQSCSGRDPTQVRSIHNIFLIGNGLSIAYALVGVKLSEWLQAGELSFAIGVPGSLLLGTFALWKMIDFYLSPARHS